MQIIVKLPESTDEKREWAVIEMQGELESRLGSGEILTGKFEAGTFLKKPPKRLIMIQFFWNNISQPLKVEDFLTVKLFKNPLMRKRKFHF